MPFNIERVAGRRCDFVRISNKNYQVLTVADRRTAILRVHLLGYHEFPVQLFCAWTCAWTHSDGCDCCFGSLHFAYCLGGKSIAKLSTVKLQLTTEVVLYETSRS